MGCDIHAYLQTFDYGKDYAWGFGGDLHLDRNYSLFGLMAGVRGGEALIEPRGLPDILCYQINGDYYLRIMDKGDVNEEGDSTCTRESAESWIKSGFSNLHPKDKKKVKNPDWHNPSWLTIDEFEKVINEYVRQELHQATSLEGIEDRKNLKKVLEAAAKKNDKKIKKRIAEIVGVEESTEKMIFSIEKGIWRAKAVLEVMKTAQKCGVESQLVFWFDN